MEKFGAISVPVPGEAASQPSSSSIRSGVQPVVPTTEWMPLAVQNSRLRITESGWVSSTATSAPVLVSSPRSESRPRAATSSRSGAASTALTASEPIRPLAPMTATRSVMSSSFPTSNERAGRSARYERTGSGEQAA